jgi:hypothetical protein
MIACSARLSCRSPPWSSRWRRTRPEEAGIGAAPARRAKAASERKRPRCDHETSLRVGDDPGVGLGVKTARGRTVTGHAPRGGQASDQASVRAPGRHRPPRRDKSPEGHPSGVRQVSGHRRRAPAPTWQRPQTEPPALSQTGPRVSGETRGAFKGGMLQAEKPVELQGKRVTNRFSRAA